MAPHSQPPSDARKDVLRAGRASALRMLNELAAEIGVPMLSSRPCAATVAGLWHDLCGASLPGHADRLCEARATWLSNNGGGHLAEELVPDTGAAIGELVAGELLENHRLASDGGVGSLSNAKPFRLKSKAFLLTFNSKNFSGDQSLWDAFLAWIKRQVTRTRAAQWSAAMECSSHSLRLGTVHLHVYFSWTGSRCKGVNSRGLDEWTFQGCYPRVDCNSEVRGPSYWLKAVQRGHFYCSAHKQGALFSATNYPPWTGVWAPEAAWVVSLYRQHKLGHDTHLRLSAMLRDGHDRRKASVEAVKATEATLAFQEERAWARTQVHAKAWPFKPLPAAVESWKMTYDEIEERYRMLVLFGPSRTGKSRLARSLFGESRTLVIDVQHAEHPDLHGLRRHHHLAILLDEVASPAFIANNKKLLQAHVDGAILGQSATQLYTYEVFLWRVPIMLTTNNWDLTGLTADQRDWIEANCVAVHVTEPVFDEPHKRTASELAAVAKCARVASAGQAWPARG